MNYRVMPLAQINLEPSGRDDFRFTESGPTKAFRQMIHRYGPLVPPLAWARDGGARYSLLAGFPVVDILVEMKRAELAAGIFDRDELDEDKAVRLALFFQIEGQRMSELDKILVARRLHRRFDFSLNRIAALLRGFEGFPKSPSRVAECLKLSFLPRNLLEALHDGRLHPSEAGLFADFIPADEREALFDTLQSRVKPGRNVLKALLDLLPDAAALQGTTPLVLVKRLLSGTGAGDVAGTPPRERASELLAALRKIRYPVMSRESALFARRASRLELPEEISLQRSPDPEDPALTVRMTLRDEQVFQRLLERLREALTRGQFRRLFDFQEEALHEEENGLR
jgi:hypothetical protein